MRSGEEAFGEKRKRKKPSEELRRLALLEIDQRKAPNFEAMPSSSRSASGASGSSSSSSSSNGTYPGSSSSESESEDRRLRRGSGKRSRSRSRSPRDGGDGDDERRKKRKSSKDRKKDDREKEDKKHKKKKHSKEKKEKKTKKKESRDERKRRERLVKEAKAFLKKQLKQGGGGGGGAGEEEEKKKKRAKGIAFPRAGTPLGSNPDASSAAPLTQDDYYLRSREFHHWLQEAKATRFNDVPSSEEARRLFDEFARDWNRGSLPRRYYSGGAFDAAAGGGKGKEAAAAAASGVGGGGGGAGARLTTHDWKLRPTAPQKAPPAGADSDADLAGPDGEGARRARRRAEARASARWARERLDASAATVPAAQRFS